MTLAVPFPENRSWLAKVGAIQVSARFGLTGSLVLLAQAVFFRFEWAPMTVAVFACFLAQSILMAGRDTPAVPVFCVAGALEAMALACFVGVIVFAGLLAGWGAGAWVAALALLAAVAAAEPFGLKLHRWWPPLYTVNGENDEARQRQAVTERELQLHEERLRLVGGGDSEERYRDLVENSSDFIFTCDGEGRFAAVNATMVRLLGYSQEQFLRLQVCDLVQPEFREATRRHLRLSAEGEPMEQVKAPWTSLTGRNVWVGISARPIVSHPGHGVRLQCIGRDMTQLHDLEEQLRQSQKMEALGRLAGGVAHDFNNLLTVINGYSDMAMNRCHGDDELLYDLQQIWKAGERAAGLTRQLLAFSRKQVVEPRTVDVNEVVTSLDKMLARVVREDVRVELALSSVPVTVTIDLSHLEQVIMNLVANASDAMPGGGSLIIRTERIMVRAGSPLSRRGIPSGPQVCLEVTDTGIGMDKKVKAHIFDPFFTTKAPGKGTGLGLSTVYGIVQQALGHILVDSQPGNGATFRVFLKPAGVAALPQDLPHRSRSHPADSGGVILLVEDSQALREFLRLTLTSCGYRALEAAGPHEALKTVEDEHIHIDLVLTDIVMAGMSGMELGRHLQRLRPELKVLYMSGYNPETAEDGLDPTYNFLQKPFSPEALSLRVKQLLSSTADNTMHAGC